MGGLGGADAGCEADGQESRSWEGGGEEGSGWQAEGLSSPEADDDGDDDDHHNKVGDKDGELVVLVSEPRR